MSISNFYSHVNFKLLQSCQFQTPAVISGQFQSISTIQFAICSAKCLVRIQEQLVPFNSFMLSSRVASSNTRTACTCQFPAIISQVASSYTRTACACQFAFVIGQVTSSNPRTACTCQFAVCFPSKPCYLLSC